MLFIKVANCFSGLEFLGDFTERERPCLGTGCASRMLRQLRIPETPVAKPFEVEHPQHICCV
jgi:hypothetical protein